MSAIKNRVLMVEDEDLIAMLVEEMLEILGYEVSASAATLAAGVDAAGSGDFDVAMLGVNLRGSLSFPIADVLTERGVPFIFVTGYGSQRYRAAFLANTDTSETLHHRVASKNIGTGVIKSCLTDRFI